MKNVSNALELREALDSGETEIQLDSGIFEGMTKHQQAESYMLAQAEMLNLAADAYYHSLPKGRPLTQTEDAKIRAFYGCIHAIRGEIKKRVRARKKAREAAKRRKLDDKRFALLRHRGGEPMVSVKGKKPAKIRRAR